MIKYKVERVGDRFHIKKRVGLLFWKRSVSSFSNVDQANKVLKLLKSKEADVNFGRDV